MESLFGHLCSGTNFAHDSEMLSLNNTQRSELQSYNMKSVEPHGLSNLNTISQESGDLKETDDEDLCLISPNKVLPLTPARVFNRHCHCTMIAKDSQNIHSMTTALPSNIRHYGRRLHGVRNNFGGWLDQPERCKASPKFDVYDAAQPQNLKLDPSMEPAQPCSVPESSTTVRRNMIQFNCRWLECNDSFGDRPSLREHVLDRHLPKGSIVSSLTYICLWRGCISANSPSFPQKRLFIEHLDRKHGLRAFAQADYEGSELALKSERISYASLSIPLVDDNKARDAAHQAVRGAKKRPFEVPDDSASSSHFDGEKHDSDRFIASPGVHVSRMYDGAGHDTQISFCDSAFESQASLHARTKTRPEQVRHRKDAYRAAKGRSELSWENDHALISASGGHGIEETEL